MINSNTKILLVYTGGTIGMIQNPRTKALETFDFEHLKNHFPEIDKFNFKVDTHVFAPPIDSSDMDPGHWRMLLKMIETAYSDYDGFVVLHGTDTMAYTASAISFMIQNLTKPVVFTGSQLPIGEMRTDAKENLITALEIAADKGEDGLPVVPEVCVFFQDYLLRGNRTVKINADNFDAFRSFNYPPLAKSGIAIKYDHDRILRPDFSKPTLFHYGLDSQICILKLFPGISQSVVKAIVEAPGIKALIIETFGSGNAPQLPWFVNMVRDAVKKGLVVVNVTQCVVGCVEMQRYETGCELLRAGVVSGLDMTTEATLAKLMFLIGQNYLPNEIKVRMRVPLVGELTRPDNKEK